MWRQSGVGWAVAGLLVAGVASNVTWKVSIDQFGERGAFVQLQASNLLYAVCAWVAAALCSGELHVRARWPLRVDGVCRLALITSVLDGAAGWIWTVAGSRTPGDWQAALQQLTLPMTLLVEPCLFARRRLVLSQASGRNLCVSACGAALVMAGVGTAVIGGGTGGAPLQTASLVALSVAALLTSASMLLKQHFLQTRSAQIDAEETVLAAERAATNLRRRAHAHVREQTMTPVVKPQPHRFVVQIFNAWNALFVCAVTLALWPLQPSFAAVFGPDGEQSTLTGSVLAGLDCIGGVPAASCASAWLWLCLATLASFASSTLSLVVVQGRSAAYQWAVSAALMPLSALAFTIPVLPAAAQQAFTVAVALGGVLIVIGIVAYEAGEQQLLAREAHEDAASAALAAISLGAESQHNVSPER